MSCPTAWARSIRPTPAAASRSPTAPYVVLNMAIMTRMGRAGAGAHRARRQLREGPAFHRRARSRAPLHHALPGRARDPELRLGLRRQRPARQEVPCAAHRELAGAHRRLAGRAHAHRRPQNPQGETHYVACAFPSACGKTNLAMLIPPGSHAGLESLHGRRRHRVAARRARMAACGRSIPKPATSAWSPGTNPETNKNAYDMIRSDTLFTNVALTADNQPWWEGRAPASR